MGKQLIVLGIIIVVIGAIWLLFGKYLIWLGNLPGDFRWESEGATFYLPLASTLLVSLIINLLWLCYKYFDSIGSGKSGYVCDPIGSKYL